MNSGRIDDIAGAGHSGEAIWDGQDVRDVNRRSLSGRWAAWMAGARAEFEGGEHGVPSRNRTYCSREPYWRSFACCRRRTAGAIR